MCKLKNYQCAICKRFFKKKSSWSNHVKICKSSEENVEAIRRFYNQGFPCEKIAQMGFSMHTIQFALKEITRTTSEASRLSHKLRPRKHSEETKQKISEKLKKSSRGWNKKSYAEDFFERFLVNNGYRKDIDFFREFPVGIYRCDFCFLKLRLVVEIDGLQHYKYKNRQISDSKKEFLLKSLGFKVLRICYKYLCKDTTLILNDVLKILQNTKEQELLIQELSNSQLRFLNLLDELQKRKLLDSEKKKNEKINKINEKLELLKSIDMSKRGWIQEAKNKLGVSGTSIRRFLRLYRPDIDKQTYFKGRNQPKKYEFVRNWKEYYRGSNSVG